MRVPPDLLAPWTRTPRNPSPACRRAHLAAARGALQCCAQPIHFGTLCVAQNVQRLLQLVNPVACLGLLDVRIHERPWRCVTGCSDAPSKIPPTFVDTPLQFRQRVQNLEGSRQFLPGPRHLPVLHSTQRGATPPGLLSLTLVGCSTATRPRLRLEL